MYGAEPNNPYRSLYYEDIRMPAVGVRLGKKQKVTLILFGPGRIAG